MLTKANILPFYIANTMNQNLKISLEKENEMLKDQVQQLEATIES